jgi:hypothetical protein
MKYFSILCFITLALLIDHYTACGAASLSGSVTYTGSQKGTVFVGVWDSPLSCSPPNPDILRYVQLSSPGAYTINNLANGNYYVGSVMITCGEDCNIRPTDPWGIYNGCSDIKPVTIAGGNKAGINVTLVNGTGVRPNPFADEEGRLFHLNVSGNSTGFVGFRRSSSELWYFGFGVPGDGKGLYSGVEAIVPFATHSPPLMYLPPKVGQTWYDTGDSNGYPVKSKAVVETLSAAVSTVAGSFTACAKVRETLTYPSGYTPGQHYPVKIERWFCPGIGPTKDVITHDDGTKYYGELTAYKIGGAAPKDYFPLALGDQWTFVSSDNNRTATWKIGEPLELVWQDNTPGNLEIYLGDSLYEGRSWSKKRFTSNSGASLNPAVALDASDGGRHIYTAWEDTSYGQSEILFKHSQDRGATWSYKRLTSNAGLSSSPAVAVTRNKVYVTWEDKTTGNKEIYVARSTDRGATLTTKRITVNGGESSHPSIAAEGSSVYVVWADNTPGNNEVYFAKSTDNGITWTTRRLTSTAGSSIHPKIAIFGAYLYVVYQDDSVGNNELYFMKSTNGGASWSTKRLTTTGGSSQNPCIAVQGDQIYVAWEENYSGNREISLLKSMNAGTTWAQQRITSNAGSSANPSLAVSVNNLYLAWEDNTPGNYEVFFGRSADKGTTWNTSRITTTSGASTKPAIAVFR